MVAMIWTEFRFVFAHSRRWDGGLLVLTFALMALISLVPFAAELMGDHPESFLAAIFTAVMGANGLLVSLNVFILQRKAHLHADVQLRHHLSRRGRAQMLIYPACATVSLAAAYLHNPLVGVIVWAFCPLALAAHLRLAGRGLGPGDVAIAAAA